MCSPLKLTLVNWLKIGDGLTAPSDEGRPSRGYSLFYIKWFTLEGLFNGAQELFSDGFEMGPFLFDGVEVRGIIPNFIIQNPWAHFLYPMDLIFDGLSVRLFHASQQRETIWS